MHMPTVIEYFGIKFRVHAGDHNPPHVHAEGKGGRAVINLATLEMIESEGFSHSDLRKIESIVLRFRADLQTAWENFNE